MSMKSYDDLFRADPGHGPIHPRLKRWQEQRAAGYSFDLNIYRKWDGLTYTPARIFVTPRKGSAEPDPIQEVLWEDELNQGLVGLEVKAIDPDNEVMRYALAFRSAFEPVSRRHGQDWFRAVLVESLRESVLSSQVTLNETLTEIHANRAYVGAGYEQARASIDNILRSKAQELETKLGYSRESSIDILSRALAQYLGEIFHLATRRLWAGK